jgi:3-methyladenine DNA glycosylase AlkD
MNLQKLRSDLKKLSDPIRAKVSQSFFKTGKGQYGEGDIFLGITVPVQRVLAKKYAGDLSLADLDKLIRSKIHEERLVALLVLVDIFQKSTILNHKSKIFQFYLSHTQWINNWDLVDLSAPKIVGAYLQDKPKTILYKLAKSKNLWEKRVAILATFDDIYHGKPEETIKIAQMLMGDSHDLIHKAVGWMLREMGKRCGKKTLINFLNQHNSHMPRTMLRYAIERLPEPQRKKYLSL